MRGARSRIRRALHRRELFALAQRDDVESRLVVRSGPPVDARARPVSPRRSRAPARARTGRCWCRASTCIRRRPTRCCAAFAFLPVRASRRPDGELRGAGRRRRPAFRLLRRVPAAGTGRRRWRYGRQDDLALEARPAGQDPAALRAVARRGARAGRHALPAAAVRARRRGRRRCTTYSIGFRAASRERARHGVPRFPARRDRPRRAATPTRTSAHGAARAHRSPRCDARSARCCGRSAGMRDTVGRFLGCWLSEPKPTVSSIRRSDRATRAAFSAAAMRARRALGHAHATALR